MTSLAALQKERAGLPKNADGHIVSPRYVPPRNSYLSLWRDYCAATPKNQWPSWLAYDIEMMKVGKRRPKKIKE
jgi:hypothetical protein